ncbi:MAG: alpha/beta hydrolase family protein [Bacteroidaceae bacterium]
MKGFGYWVLMALCIAWPLTACDGDNDEFKTPDHTEQPDNTSSDSTATATDSAAVTPPVEWVDSMEYCCMRDSNRIYGMLYLNPLASNIRPAVILSHSSSLTHEAMAGYALMLARQGFVAYCFDFCGGSADSKSDGDASDMTVFTEVEDLRTVVNDVKRLGFVDRQRVYLMGSSQGGLVSALLADEEPDAFAGMVLFYPAFNIPDMVAQFAGLGSWGGSFGLSQKYMDSMKDFDVWAHVGSFPHPVCIVHGTSDIIVDISYSEKAEACYPNARLHRIQGANHGFNAANYGSMGSSMGMKDYDDVVMPIVYEFLKKE